MQQTLNAESPPAVAPAAAPAAHQCECGGKTAAAPAQVQAEEFVYALGRFEVRFPSLGIEREFRQREAHRAGTNGKATAIVRTLREHSYLAERVSYYLTISGLPAYLLVPTSRQVRDSILDGLEANSIDGRSWSLVIGRRGSIAPPMLTGGILAPLVAADLVYNFSFEEWRESLREAVADTLRLRNLDDETFHGAAEELFSRVAASTQSAGASDAHRALNYVLTQHPGPFLAAAERAENAVLDRIETRLIHDMGARRIVAVIFTFLHRMTGIAERLVCRVDVTEEWPFVADMPSGWRTPLALQPYVENELWSAPL